MIMLIKENITKILNRKSNLKIKFSINFCENHNLKYSFAFKETKYTFVDKEVRTINFLNDFLNQIYYYLISYEKKQIQHNNYYSSMIRLGEDKIIDVEFKLIKPTIFGFRIWERDNYSIPNSKSNNLIKTQLNVIDFLNIVLIGYSNFLKKYGFTQIADRYGEKEFPLFALLKLMQFLELNHLNQLLNFKDLELNIPYEVETDLLKY